MLPQAVRDTCNLRRAARHRALATRSNELKGDLESVGGVLEDDFFFQAEDGIRDAQESRGLGDVYKRQAESKE